MTVMDRVLEVRARHVTAMVKSVAVKDISILVKDRMINIS